MGKKLLKTLYWEEGKLHLLNQKLLPAEVSYVCCRSAGEVAAAIKDMVVRGAPAIGVSAAFAMVLAARQGAERGLPADNLHEFMQEEAGVVAASRPTAVNLFWALERMDGKRAELAGCSCREIAEGLEKEALTIMEEDLQINKKIGDNGAGLLPEKGSVLTHCNAGALAATGYGTALAVIRAAVNLGKDIHVFIDETRPLFQGARLTALELMEDKIEATLITDSCAAFLFSKKSVDAVITGADCIAANGDTANKIGTYNLAVLARYHHVPFYIAAPCSTINRRIKSGGDIIIEERRPEEITHIFDRSLAPAGIKAYNPAFDITPASLISAIITERGVVNRPDQNGLGEMLAE